MSKRLLGVILVILGLGGALAILAVDWFGAGAFQGIGPAQRVALIVAAGVFLVGLSLLPLGDRPA